MNRYFIIPVTIFFTLICIFVFYLQFIDEDWKFMAPKKIIPKICNDEKEVEIIYHPEDYIANRSFKDNPDKFETYQFHAIYLLPCEKEDRKFDVEQNINFSILSINNWLKEKTKDQKISFDKKNDDMIDVTFIRVNKTMNWFTKFSNNEVGKKNTALKIENIILSNANLFNNFEKKKFIIFFEGWEKRTSLFADICGRSRFNGKIAIFYTSGKWKKNIGNKNKMFSCLNDSLNLSAEEEFGESEGTILHEILHSLGAPPQCAKNLDQKSKFHVDDNENDILYKMSGDQFFDFNNDDYYNHQIANCPDLAESNYFIN